MLYYYIYVVDTLTLTLTLTLTAMFAKSCDKSAIANYRKVSHSDLKLVKDDFVFVDPYTTYEQLHSRLILLNKTNSISAFILITSQSPGPLNFDLIILFEIRLFKIIFSANFTVWNYSFTFPSMQCVFLDF